MTTTYTRSHIFAATLVLLIWLPAVAWSQAKTLGRAVPREIINPPWLDSRAQAQMATQNEFSSFIGFEFEDRAEESGIRFTNRVVEDAAISYKAVHYDHGNGLAVADIDNDGNYDIYFVNQAGSNELWRNQGDGTFEDITAKSGLAMSDRISVSASFGDIDNDGDADLFVTSVRAGNMLFKNRGDGTFEDISEESGLNHKGHSSGAVWFDYDRDGLIDLYLTNVGQYTTEEIRDARHGDVDYQFHDGMGDAFGGHRIPERYESNILYRNTGNNRFENISDIILDAKHGWAGDATVLDLNEDGWPDIYELNMQGNDQYYENQGGKSFIRKSREIFPKTSWGAMGIKVFDWNNDGLMDIYITDMHSDMSAEAAPDKEHLKSDMQWNEAHLMTQGQSVFGNTFFENQGNGVFDEISDRIGVENYWPWGLSIGDLNADGYQDAFVTSSMNFPFRYQTNTLFINEQGQRFRAAEFILGVEPRKDRKTAQPWFDLQCSDPVESAHKLCTGATGHVQAWGAVGSRSSVMFDLDNDGDLDIVTNEFNRAPQVLISDRAQQDRPLNYLKVVLQGGRSNRSGLGAKVIVTTDKGRFHQVLDGKSGYLSHSLKPLYFGLDDATSIREVTVHWPSGISQVISEPNINKLMSIREPIESSLKKGFSNAFLVGSALNRGQIMGENKQATELVKQQFNSLTPENVMKWEKIEPEEGEFDWQAADELVDFAEANDIHIAGHVLVWHQQTPDWVFDGPDGGPASRELLLQRMESHISAVVGRYRGRVDSWEVVNEVFEEDGRFRRSPWYEIIGEDFISKAFEFAHEADPDAYLYFNDYNMYKPEKRQAAIRLGQSLKEQGLRLDAIGMQAHYGLDNPKDLQQFEDSILAISRLGLDVLITEMDVSVLVFPDQEDWSADISVNLELSEKFNPFASGLPREVEQAQIDQYSKLFRILLKHREHVARVTFWGLTDGDSWKNNWPMHGRTDYPLLFDRNYQPKPVFHSLMELNP